MAVSCWSAGQSTSRTSSRCSTPSIAAREKTSASPASGQRSAFLLLREGNAIGTISLTRREARLFSEEQLALLQTFAEQAVIAIENVRLLSETKEALEHRTATAEILKVINRSSFDLQTVLDTLVQSAARLCDADHAWLFRRDRESYRWAASFGHATEHHERIKQYMLAQEIFPGRGNDGGANRARGLADRRCQLPRQQRNEAQRLSATIGTWCWTCRCCARVFPSAYWV